MTAIRRPLRSPLRSPVRAAARFSPRDLGSDLLAWWDARVTSSLTLAAGSLVTTWTDVVGGLAPTQGTDANKPIYSAAGVTFDNTDVLVVAGVGSLPTGANPVSIWLVLNQPTAIADTTTYNIFTYGGGSGATSRSVRRLVASSVNRFNALPSTGAGTTSVTNTNVDFSGWHWVGCHIDADSTIAFIDGTSSTDTANALGGTGTTRTSIGGTAGGAANYVGTIRHILVTNNLSATMQPLLMRWLDSQVQ